MQKSADAATHIKGNIESKTQDSKGNYKEVTNVTSKKNHAKDSIKTNEKEQVERSETFNGNVRSTNLVSPAQLAVLKSEEANAEVHSPLFSKELDKRGTPPLRKKSGCFFLQRGSGEGDLHFFAQSAKDNTKNDTQNHKTNKHLDSIESKNVDVSLNAQHDDRKDSKKNIESKNTKDSKKNHAKDSINSQSKTKNIHNKLDSNFTDVTLVTQNKNNNFIESKNNDSKGNSKDVTNVTPNKNDKNDKEIKILFPKIDSKNAINHIESLQNLKALSPFNNDVCEFLNKLSQKILQDKEAKNYPDIITFGFFCRGSNLAKLKQQYDVESRLGRGLSFHIAPSNVAINFAFSLIASLLAGNANIVRVSSKDFAQTRIICRILDSIESIIKDYICIVQYPHSRELNDKLSQIADNRIIWGGDKTIENVRLSPLKPRSVELAFANRYSLCVIETSAILNLDSKDLGKLARDFYNDTYLYDQNACSSPFLIFWLGLDCMQKAREKFWNAIFSYVKNRYEMQDIIALDKLVNECKMAIDLDSIHVQNYENLIDTIFVPNLESIESKSIKTYATPGGSFIESSGNSLESLFNIIDSSYQTLSYFGLDSKTLQKEIIKKGLKGIDRIVPMGQTSNFSLTWDGYDLITSLSRKIDKI